MVIWFKLCW